MKDITHYVINIKIKYLTYIQNARKKLTYNMVKTEELILQYQGKFHRMLLQ